MMSNPRDVAWYMAICALFDIACAATGLLVGLAVWKLAHR